jgi:two-component system OmpR family sensor kinase
VLGQRLFWKILLGFWLTFVLITQGLWASVVFISDGRSPLKGYYQQMAAPVVTSAAAWVIEHQGINAIPALMAQWQDVDRQALRIVADGAALDEPERYQDVLAQAPDGTVYRLRYTLPEHIFIQGSKPAPWDIPREILILGVIGGFAFSTILAWYLAQPIQTLRHGFGRLAAGDLSVRLGAHMGRRRDELADLALFFDLMAERLQHLVEAREQLLHDVSHELRSPLARLQMAVGLARQSPQKTAASLDRIEAEGQRLNDLVGELLTLSRVEAGAYDPDEYFDAFALVRSVVTDAQFEAQTSTVTITMVGHLAQQDGPTLSGNPRLVRRSLENVVRNALRFSPRGGVIEVDVTLSAEKSKTSLLLITVSDQGPGVASDDLQRIFDPFVRGIDARANTGFGLGLSIARRTIEAHGGTIRARNRNDNPLVRGGLCVEICLPI